MVFNNICALVLWTKVASAFEELRGGLRFNMAFNSLGQTMMKLKPGTTKKSLSLYDKFQGVSLFVA